MTTPGDTPSHETNPQATEAQAHLETLAALYGQHAALRHVQHTDVQLPWPLRQQSSAQVLVEAAHALQGLLRDPVPSSHLLTLSDTSEEAQVTVTHYNQLLRSALGALLDLTAIENPEQAYPDVTQDFLVTCPNYQYGAYVTQTVVPKSS